MSDKQNQRDNAPRVERKDDQKPQLSDASVKSDNKSMMEKTQPALISNKNESSDDKMLVRVLVLGLIIITLLVVIVMGILLLVTRANPKLDKKIERPVLNELSQYTKEDSVKIEGTYKGSNKVMLYVNDKSVSTLVDVKDGKFSYTYKFASGEKKYKFEAVGIKGVIIRSRGEKSNAVYTTFDKTAPSSDITFDYDKEVTTSPITIKGKTEANATVTLKKGDNSYSAKADESGNFEIKDIALESGDNEFSASISDEAGNVNNLSQKLKVTYSTSSSLNGSGTTTTTPTTELPNSAGVLDDALATMSMNKFMFGFGIFALIALIVNSGFVILKLKKE